MVAGGMVVGTMAKTAHQCGAIGTRGKQRQVLGIPDSRYLRGDGAKFTTDGIGGIRLGIKAFMLRQTTRQKHKNNSTMAM
jgi:hypothetical protein